MQWLRRHRRWLFAQALIWGLAIAILRVAVVPAETCPPVDRAQVSRAVDGAAAWLVRGLRPDGRFLYGYHRDTGEVSPLYNDTRHAGVLLVLYRVGDIRGGDAGLQYVLDNLVRHGDWTAFAPPGTDADAGGNALLVTALVHRRLATGDPRYDELLHRLGRFLAAQTEPDGSVLQYWSQATRDRVPGLHGPFATGETAYAFALLNRAFPGEGWDRRARSVVAYLATRRDAAEGYSTRQADHWAAYALSELAPYGLSDVEVEFARRLAGYFGYEIRFESAHTGRPTNIFTESGADLGVVGEGEAAIRRVAARDPRLADLRPALDDRIACIAGITVRQQVPPTDPDPRQRGAWFFHDYTQMDDQQHAIGALLGSQQVVR